MPLMRCVTPGNHDCIAVASPSGARDNVVRVGPELHACTTLS